MSIPLQATSVKIQAAALVSPKEIRIPKFSHFETARRLAKPQDGITLLLNILNEGEVGTIYHAHSWKTFIAPTPLHIVKRGGKIYANCGSGRRILEPTSDEFFYVYGKGNSPPGKIIFASMNRVSAQEQNDRVDLITERDKLHSIDVNTLS